MADSTPKSYHSDPNLYLYTSLTAGSSHIITATSRLETILKANRIPFQALDVATDEKARMLWGRRAGKRKLPGLVRMGMLIGDLEEIEEWNEYGELKEKVGVTPLPSTPSAANTPTKAPTSKSAAPSAMSSNSESPLKSLSSTTQTPPRPSASSSTDSPMTTALRQAAMEAAKKAGDAKAAKFGAARSGGTSSSIPAETQKKLDNSAPTGMLPVTGTTDAETTKAPESTAVSETDPAPEKGNTNTTNEEDDEETYEGMGSNDPDAEAVVPNSKDTIDLERDAKTGAHGLPPDSSNPEPPAEKIKETKSTTDDPDAEAVVPDSEAPTSSAKTAAAIEETQNQVSEAKGRNTVKKTTEATTSSEAGVGEGEGRKTQEQGSAEAGEAGVSVGD
ncbi:MAG: hypothetical protein LQ350_008276 [Teloschistes chrysophthalmus]|nr:MAG: hypothetical protein LQ350_008276 [Niorma chrysophthalma]